MAPFFARLLETPRNGTVRRTRAVLQPPLQLARRSRVASRSPSSSRDRSAAARPGPGAGVGATRARDVHEDSSCQLRRLPKPRTHTRARARDAPKARPDSLGSDPPESHPTRTSLQIGGNPASAHRGAGSSVARHHPGRPAHRPRRVVAAGLRARAAGWSCPSRADCERGASTVETIARKPSHLTS
jgi:hypothetical protein